jgi:osmotically inducible lipoprotein OsmB
MKRWITVSTLVAFLAAGSVTTGCANMTPAQQRALSGGAIGAGAGALIGGATGDNAAAGAAIGGAAGAAGGYLYQKSRDNDREWWYRHR